MKNKIQYYQKLLQKAESSLEKITLEGSLIINKKKSSVGYYHDVKTDGKRIRKYLPKSELKTRKLLAQKYYLKKLIPLLKEKIKHLEKLSSYNEYARIDDIYKNLQPEKKDLVVPIKTPNNDLIQRWLNTDFQTNPYMLDQLKYPTKSGLKVRSKSESMISDLLTNKELCHLYEILLELDGKPIYPDFAIMHPDTLEIVYLEHFGLMDDEYYRNEALSKIIKYEKAGYFLGKNLIITFESSNVPLDMEWISKKIDEVFFKI